MKRYHIIVIREVTIKPRWDTFRMALKKPNPEILSADKNVELMGVSYTAGGNAKMNNHLKNWLAVSYKLTYTYYIIQYSRS